ncbi:MAG: aspartate aminotransferase family protein [Candidatus Methanosuratincola sp.]|jgi:acetylornithine/LysW-gamma-L-lysine aminotransferase|uniref:Putative [LysW]-aminoadipate semialdehyde/glutamate semialdehyde transaminase n=1 Tax=Candidatus Methanosuratincola petrocarbonis (ex Vanwonterghem et al. 2016) TaxID=1867261 RepID=A0A7J3V097_9CREN|nr:aspartate aminotransferase family protein [Candidatus Methanosuratincola sp.]
MNFEDTFLADTFWKRPVQLVRGKGARVWDSNGKEYIDCSCGYGVALLGHCHPKVVEAINRQASRLLTCHGSFYNDAREECLSKLYKIRPEGTERVFLSSTGAEAVETAIKLSRKFTRKKGFIAAVNAYHGKTMGALSLTWASKYREPFMPLLDGVKFAPYGKAEKVRDLIDQDTAAVFVEPVQGEGGINVPPKEYLKELREICDEKGVLLVLDEVQSGFGRTGKIWAHQHFGVKPDILCSSKALGGGVPIAATFAREDVMASLKRGEHSNTFGGNPLACAACAAAVDALMEEGLVENARDVGEELKRGLSSIGSPMVREVRGLGLMIGVDMRFETMGMILRCLEGGVICLEAGKTVLRLLPPLVLSKEEAKTVVETVGNAVMEEEKKIKGA